MISVQRRPKLHRLSVIEAVIRCFDRIVPRMFFRDDRPGRDPERQHFRKCFIRFDAKLVFTDGTIVSNIERQDSAGSVRRLFHDIEMVTQNFVDKFKINKANPGTIKQKIFESFQLRSLQQNFHFRSALPDLRHDSPRDGTDVREDAVGFFRECGAGEEKSEGSCGRQTADAREGEGGSGGGGERHADEISDFKFRITNFQQRSVKRRRDSRTPPLLSSPLQLTRSPAPQPASRHQ